MNAVATPTPLKAPAKAAKKASQQDQPPSPATAAPLKQPAKPSPVLEDLDNQLFDALHVLQETGAVTNESESGLLLMVAVDIIDNLKVQLAESNPLAFKSALRQCTALIKAARRSPGYKDAPKQAAGLNEAEAILNALTGPQAIDKPTATNTLTTQSTDTFASTAWCRVGEAEAVIQAYAEDCGSAESWAVHTIVDAAKDILSRTHQAPKRADCQTASNYLAQTIAIGSLVTDENPNLLLEAGLSLLVLAKEILDTGWEGVSNA